MIDYTKDICAFITDLCRVDSDYSPDGIPLVPDYDREWLARCFPPESGGLPSARNFADFRSKKEMKTTRAAFVALFTAARTPGGEVLIISSDLDQSRDRVLAACKYSVEHGPLGNHATVLKDSITFDNGARIIALPADWRGSAGSNHTCVICDEMWVFTTEGLQRLFDETIPPPSRRFGFRWLSSYAGIENESTLLKSWWDRALEGEQVSQTLPIYHNPDASLLAFVDVGEASWRAPWLQGESGRAYIETVQKTERPETFQRLWLNQWTAGESAFVSPEAWDACKGNIMRWHPGDGRRMVLACDASTAKDSTGIVGTVYDPQSQKVEIIYTRLFLPSVLEIAGSLFRGGRKSIDLLAVRDCILELHKQHAIAELRFDPYQLSAISQEWAQAGVPLREIVQGAPRIECDTALRDLINAGGVVHDGDDNLRAHVLNSVMRESVRGSRLDKKTANRKIDLCVCLSMSASGALRGQPALSYSFAYGGGRATPADLRRERLARQMAEFGISD